MLISFTRTLPIWYTATGDPAARLPSGLRIRLTATHMLASHRAQMSSRHPRLSLVLCQLFRFGSSVTSTSPSFRLPLFPALRHCYVAAFLADSRLPLRRHYRPHSLPSSFSPLGSNSPNEFATFVQGREAWLANPEFRDGVEESLRVFAEKSDETEVAFSSPRSLGGMG